MNVLDKGDNGSHMSRVFLVIFWSQTEMNLNEIKILFRSF